MFFGPLSIAITSLGEERDNLSAFRAFVRFALVLFCLFFFILVSGRGCGLWLGYSLDFSLTFFPLNMHPFSLRMSGPHFKMSHIDEIPYLTIDTLFYLTNHFTTLLVKSADDKLMIFSSLYFPFQKIDFDTSCILGDDLHEVAKHT